MSSESEKASASRATDGHGLGKPARHGRLAGHRIALCFGEERRSRDAELAARVDPVAGRQARRLAARPVRQHFGGAIGPSTPGRARRFGEGHAKLGMVRRAMVALAIVLPDELPVRLARQSCSRARPLLRKPVRREIGRHHAAKRREIGRRIGQGRQRGSPGALASDGFKSVSGLVETLGHLAGEQEPAVEIVAPLVIGADEADGRDPFRSRRSGCRGAGRYCGSARIVPLRSRRNDWDSRRSPR